MSGVNAERAIASAYRVVLDWWSDISGGGGRRTYRAIGPDVIGVDDMGGLPSQRKGRVVEECTILCIQPRCLYVICAMTSHALFRLYTILLLLTHYYMSL